MLQDLGHCTQVPPLVGVDLTAGGHVDDVEAVRGYDSRVHVPVVQEVPNDLQRCRRLFLRGKTQGFGFFSKVNIDRHFLRRQILFLYK